MPTHDALDPAQLREAAERLQHEPIDMSQPYWRDKLLVAEAIPHLLALAEAAQKLLDQTGLVYHARDDPACTPVPTCVGCGGAGWGEIQHYPGCSAVALRAALKELVS
jgi:hypothetical protein